MIKIKAILFDLDGVLVETRKLHFQALALALKEIHRELSFEEHQRLYDGLPTYKKIELLTDRFALSQLEIDFVNQRKQEHTVKLLEGSIHPSKELNLIMDYLREKKIQIAVCSNTKRYTLDHILEKLGINKLINFSLSNEDVANPKPSPEIYIKAMEKLNVSPEEVIIFEDSPHGIEAAKKSKANLQIVTAPDQLTLDLLKRTIHQ